MLKGRGGVSDVSKLEDRADPASDIGEQICALLRVLGPRLQNPDCGGKSAGPQLKMLALAALLGKDEHGVHGVKLRETKSL